MTATDRRNGLIGNTAIKAPCRAATTGAITLSGEQTIDAIACVTGDRVLVKNQAAGADNGIYVVDTGAWTRATDFNGPYDLLEGTLVLVTSGTANADLLFQQTAASPTIGTTSLVFAAVFNTATITAYMLTVLAAANAAAARALLGLAIGTDVQAYDAQLSSLIRQNSQIVAYTTVLADGGKHILHPTADNNPRTFTIDSNANAAYPIGTAITFVNQINTVTIAITSDVLTLQGAGTTGSRTLAANGIATALKIDATHWVISGTGLT